MKKYGVDSAGVEPAAHIFININQFSYEKNTNSEICHNRVCPFSPHPRRRGHDKNFIQKGPDISYRNNFRPII